MPAKSRSSGNDPIVMSQKAGKPLSAPSVGPLPGLLVIPSPSKHEGELCEEALNVGPRGAELTTSDAKVGVGDKMY